jgi:hypothetical protein
MSISIEELQKRIEELELELKPLKKQLEQKMKDELIKKIEEEHTELVINKLVEELIENTIQSQKEKYCDYCGEEGEIVKHHGDKCCKKCLSYEDEEYCNCKECGRLIERDSECEDCKKELKVDTSPKTTLSAMSSPLPTPELKIDTTLPPLPSNLSMSPMSPTIVEEPIVVIEEPIIVEEPVVIVETINYKKMKVPALKKLCKSRKIKKYSKLKKDKLIELLKK